MSTRRNRRRFGLLPALIVIVYLISVAPISRTQAKSYCDPVGCIEYTEWNPATCRCECTNQDCCDFYYPFVPYGCPFNLAAAGTPQAPIGQMTVNRSDRNRTNDSARSSSKR